MDVRQGCEEEESRGGGGGGHQVAHGDVDGDD
jgi:hypothetical protein